MPREVVAEESDPGGGAGLQVVPARAIRLCHYHPRSLGRGRSCR
jgi:hypothetical protein